MFSLKPVKGDKLPIFSTGMIGQYAHGNEPSHHVAYLYNYVEQPSKTQELVKKIREEQYRNEPNGHCGNEDCGQMSSWFVLSALGIYPVNPAQGVLDLGAPMFEEATIALPEGKTFTIKGQNLSDQNKYVKAVYLNEEPLDRWFITYDEMMEGGALIFEMTNLPVDHVGNDYTLPEPNKVY